MRWQQLFADLQAQFDEEEAAAERSDAASRARAEIGAIRLAERLRGALGFPVVLGCRGAGSVSGVLTDAGVDWLLLAGDGGREDLVALRAVRTVGGLGRRTAVPEPAGGVWSRLDLRRALRGLARDRSVVQVILDDGVVLAGTLDRVGVDYVELAEHPADQPRRPEAVQGVRAVVLETIAVVRTAAPGLG
jgi:hypothetical protein